MNEKRTGICEEDMVKTKKVRAIITNTERHVNNYTNIKTKNNFFRGLKQHSKRHITLSKYQTLKDTPMSPSKIVMMLIQVPEYRSAVVTRILLWSIK